MNAPVFLSQLAVNESFLVQMSTSGDQSLQSTRCSLNTVYSTSQFNDGRDGTEIAEERRLEHSFF